MDVILSYTKMFFFFFFFFVKNSVESVQEERATITRHSLPM